MLTVEKIRVFPPFQTLQCKRITCVFQADDMNEFSSD